MQRLFIKYAKIKAGDRMVNYPIKKKLSTCVDRPEGNKPKKQKNAIMANKGMNLEGLINDSNEYYRALDKAIIYKKPIPIQIVKVDYPSRNHAVIREAYYKTPSTTDYNGVYRGKYIDFEAKENKNKTSFPLHNVHPHQVVHLKSIAKHGGIGFLIVYWIEKNQFFLYPIEAFAPHFDEGQNGGRKSITYEDFLKEAYLINEKYQPKLDYLAVIDELYFKD